VVWYWVKREVRDWELRGWERSDWGDGEVTAWWRRLQSVMADSMAVFAPMARSAVIWFS
jgi:hypothetical protein